MYTYIIKSSCIFQINIYTVYITLKFNEVIRTLVLNQTNLGIFLLKTLNLFPDLSTSIIKVGVMVTWYWHFNYIINYIYYVNYLNLSRLLWDIFQIACVYAEYAKYEESRYKASSPECYRRPCPTRDRTYLRPRHFQRRPQSFLK